MEKTLQNEVEMLASDTSEMEGKYLTFWTDEQLFGVPIADVVQIVGVQEITPIPEYPMYAKGIMNLRGTIIPVIDVRLRFGKFETEYNERTCTIVTNIRDHVVGLIVDSVEEVTDIDDADIAPPPQLTGERAGSYITGLGKQDGRVILLLDTQKILSLDDLESFSGVDGMFA